MTTQDIPSRPIWFDPVTGTVQVIDQRRLPHELVVMDLSSVDAVIEAIVEMVVRGAPLIGVTAAYGVHVACRTAGEIDDHRLRHECARIRAARPGPTSSVPSSWLRSSSLLRFFSSLRLFSLQDAF